MTKRQMIDEIVAINQTAQPQFLAAFDDSDLGEYLQHLRLAKRPRLTGDASRYAKYFVSVPVAQAAAAEPTVQEDESSVLSIADQLPAENEYEPAEDPVEAEACEETPTLKLAEPAVSVPTTAIVVARPAHSNSRTSFAGAEEETEAWLFNG